MFWAALYGYLPAVERWHRFVRHALAWAVLIAICAAPHACSFAAGWWIRGS